MSFLQLRSSSSYDFILLSYATVTTQAASSVTASTATGNGTVVTQGGSAVTVRGFVWSSSNSNPTLADSSVTSGSGTGVYTGSITGLAGTTLYYYRAYATNGIGTAYGDVMTFTTTETATAFFMGRMLMGMGI